MKNIIQELRLHLDNSKSKDPETLRVMAKEYLQSYALGFIYNHSRYKKLAFYGGTCAKIVYGLNRLSEDIDLDNHAKIDLTHLGQDLQDLFTGKLQIDNTYVHTQGGELGIKRWTVRLPVLYQLKLSPLKNEKLHLKIEVSHHQQLANRIQTPVNIHNQSFVTTHYDLPSLMAGKMIACLERVFKKSTTNIQVRGRDYYDLIWYMQQQIQPLEEKIKAESQGELSVKAAFEKLDEKVKKLNKKDLAADLVAFFDNRVFIDTWLDNFQEFFQRYAEFYLN